jgi:hypothetical protein
MKNIGLTLGICLTGCVILAVVEKTTGVKISTSIYLVWGIAAGLLSTAIGNRM